jgi:hypothetical protein
MYFFNFYEFMDFILDKDPKNSFTHSFTSKIPHEDERELNQAGIADEFRKNRKNKIRTNVQKRLSMSGLRSIRSFRLGVESVTLSAGDGILFR